MKVVYAEEFVKQFRNLPASVQRLYRRQEALFKQNWRDPRLHTKKLLDRPFPFSFRITRNYRVLFVFIDEDTALFATIGHRKDVYKKINRRTMAARRLKLIGNPSIEGR